MAESKNINKNSLQLNCPACGREEIHLLHSRRVKQNGKGILASDYNLYACCSCHLWFKDSMYDSLANYKYANSEYEESKSTIIKRALYQKAINKIVSRLSKGATLLFAACVHENIKNSSTHIHKFGIEVNEKKAVLAEQNGIHILGPYLNKQHLGEYKFDLIVLDEIVEKIPNPFDTIKTLLRHLRPNGQLIIICSSTDGLEIKAEGAAYTLFSSRADDIVFINKGFIQWLCNSLIGYTITFKRIRKTPFNFLKFTNEQWKLIKSLFSNNNMLKIIFPSNKANTFTLQSRENNTKYKQFKDHLFIRIKKNIS
jgi:SAM-dependent methyltransferase